VRDSESERECVRASERATILSRALSLRSHLSRARAHVPTRPRPRTLNSRTLPPARARSGARARSRVRSLAHGRTSQAHSCACSHARARPGRQAPGCNGQAGSADAPRGQRGSWRLEFSTVSGVGCLSCPARLRGTSTRRAGCRTTHALAGEARSDTPTTTNRAASVALPATRRSMPRLPAPAHRTARAAHALARLTRPPHHAGCTHRLAPRRDDAPWQKTSVSSKEATKLRTCRACESGAWSQDLGALVCAGLLQGVQVYFTAGMLL